MVGQLYHDWCRWLLGWLCPHNSRPRSVVHKLPSQRAAHKTWCGEGKKGRSLSSMVSPVRIYYVEWRPCTAASFMRSAFSACNAAHIDRFRHTTLEPL